MTEKTSPFLQMNAAPPSPGRKLSRAIGVSIGVLFLVLVVAAVWWRFIAQPSLIFEAVVDGQRGVITAKTDARVAEVQAASGQIVSAGQPLVFLVPLAGVDKAADIRATLETMRERVTAGEQAEKKAREDMERASLDHARKQLALRGAGQPVPGSEASRQEHERLRSEERKARSELEAVKNRAEAASLARQNVESVYRHMRDAARQAQANGTQADLAQTVMTAPIAGKISILDAAPGMQVRSGQTLVVIEPVLPEQIWVTGFVKPANLTKLRAGKVFALRFPDQPKLHLTGQVDAVQENAPQKDLPGLPVRVRINDYDPVSMPALIIGQKVDIQEQ